MFRLLTKQFVQSILPVTLLAIVVATMTSCSTNPNQSVSSSPQDSSESQDVSQPALPDTTELTKQTPVEQEFARQREQMVEKHMAARDIVDQRVLDVMKRVPRHKFVPAAIRPRAYQDSPLPIGHRQTISQPYIVALMTQLVEPKQEMKALDIGTGSGYQAAVLAELVQSVHSIEIVEPLAKEARDRLQQLGYKNVTVRHGDGYQGWKSEAPFDIIIVAAAPDHIPQPLVDQLAPNGKMVIPVGKYAQDLLIIEKQSDGTVVKKNVAPVAFVPMTGTAQEK